MRLLWAVPASGQLVFFAQKFQPKELYFCPLGKTHHFLPKAARPVGWNLPTTFRCSTATNNVTSFNVVMMRYIWHP